MTTPEAVISRAAIARELRAAARKLGELAEQLEERATPAADAGGRRAIDPGQMATVLDRLAEHGEDGLLRDQIRFVATQLRGNGFIILPASWT